MDSTDNMELKYIFLDIDGVLATSKQFYMKRKELLFNTYPFDPKCVLILNNIIEATNAKIILSSDWKNHYDLIQMNEIFRLNEISSKIIAFTDNLWGVEFFMYQDISNCRAREILKYVADYKINNYIVIDDLPLSTWIDNDNFIHCTKISEGIKQCGIKDKIINKLNNKLNNKLW